jgi:hypothetical protein
MAKLTFPEALTGVGTVQIDSDAGSLQVKVIVPEKPEATATATVAFTLAPCVTWKLVAVGVSVNAGATVTVAALDVELASDALPMYVAVRLFVPTGSVVTATVAVPPEIAAVPIAAVPLLNTTFPMAVDGVTAAVSVTLAL